MHFTIRPAGPEDAALLTALIEELAEYERLSHEAHPDAEALARYLAPSASPRCEAFLAERPATGEAVGFALYFFNFSTFLTRWGIYLEDLYVRPEARGEGVGFALLRSVAEVAVSKECERMEWSVLTWNDLALDFYDRLGARRMEEWRTMRLTGDALHRLGSGGANLTKE